MLPFEKAKWFLGYSSLIMMTEQDRRHWLLKTDRIKQAEDTNDGSLYLGQIDNQAAYINISTQKLGYTHPVLKQYLPPNFKTVLELCGSALPFSYDVRGLCCARLISSQYPYQGTNKNFKIVFEDCEEVWIPFGGESNIFAYHFIKTTTSPKLLMLDGFNQYTIEVSIDLLIHNQAFYYPLDTFQPIEITSLGNGKYETVLIDNDNFVGYPAFWFTSDETLVGPEFHEDDTIQKLHYGNLKDETYNTQVFVMDRTYQTNDEIHVYPQAGYTFNGTDADYFIPIDLDRIKYEHSGSPVTVEDYPFTYSTGDKLYLMKDVGWTLSQYGYYAIALSNFDSNSGHQIALKPIFKLELDNSIPFEHVTNDTGAAGVDITSGTNIQYPFNLNEWDGLPEWIQNSSQRLVAYAIHDTPNSSEENPQSRQTAALLFDPGTPITDNDEPTLTNEQRGRIYLLSNDEAEYTNNATATYQKPARTLARICDIPVSVAQLSNISGLAPNPIVDPKYVRSEASYTQSEQERLYNTLSSRWVRPIHVDETNTPIINNYPDETDEYVFAHEEDLNAIDLINNNDFRVHENLNRSVNPQDVSLYSIVNRGSGYEINSLGVIIIGGFAFDYIVQSVDENGAVTELTVSPSGDYPINLANFDMEPGTSGITSVYGTSPRESQSGTGLKIQLRIANYTDLIPTLGDIYPDLFALCRTSNGLWMYNYDTTENEWNKTVCLAQYEETTPSSISLKDSYINSILPNVNELPVSTSVPNAPDTSLKVISTASFVNVVDTARTPVEDTSNTTQQLVDINRFYCDNVRSSILSAGETKSFESILAYIKANHYDRFDSYFIWRWKNDSDPTDKRFEFGFIRRSFNNLQSYDQYRTNLPLNELPCNNYVNTNASTTIAWDLPDNDITMVWMFNPNSNIHEKYAIDSNTRELVVDRISMEWKDVDIYTDGFQSKLDMVDANGNLLWNIATNMLIYSTDSYAREPIYEQPEYHTIISKGVKASSLAKKYQLNGNWELVFPRIQTFKFTDNTNTFNPMKMNVLRNPGIISTSDIMDMNGKPVNYKTMVIDTTEENTSLKIYNSETGTWESI